MLTTCAVHMGSEWHLFLLSPLLTMSPADRYEYNLNDRYNVCQEFSMTWLDMA